MEPPARPLGRTPAHGAARRLGGSGDDAPARPFTAMGSAELDLLSTQANARHGPTDREFDVRQFLLDQKGEQPLHKSALFRAPAPLPLQAVAASSRGAARLGSPSPAGSPGPAFREPKARKTLLPRMEAAQSTGSLPRPATVEVLPPPRRGDGPLQLEPNNPEEEEGGAISHFYTLERMAESCYHAVQNRNKTWLFLPGADERSKGTAGSGGLPSTERPARRADLLDLQRCLDAALQFVSRRHDGDVECSERLAMVDRDFAAIQTRVADKYAAATDDAEAAAAGHKALARLLFEQKWADVVLGELEAMLTVAFLEQGVALRKARILSAQAFFRLEQLYASQWEQLRAAQDDLRRLREDLRRAGDVHAQNAREMTDRYEAELARLSAGFEASKGDMERRVAESKDQMTKMGDTMKTLNAVFRQMREDTEKVKAVELRESLVKLEHKYEQACEEVARLRPLVEQNQQLHAQLDALLLERDTFKDDMAQLDVLLTSKDETIASLMEQQSDLLAAQELREAKEEELRKRAAEEEEEDDDNDDDERDGRESTSPEATSTDERGVDSGQRRQRSARARRTRRAGSSAVCMRCKQELRAMSANGGVAESAALSPADPSTDAGDRGGEELGGGPTPLQMKRKRVQCLYFRILLPNLRGRRPQREPAWTISCMRAILFAKQIDDTMCRRSGGAFPTRIRMPEFVYAWFSPWRSIQDEKLEAEYGAPPAASAAAFRLGGGEPGEDEDENGGDGLLVRSFLSAEQSQMQADEERWCLYYGVKALVQQGYLEAKLFLSLLDEKFGEDELVFLLYCYQLLDVLAGGRLHWGPLRHKVAYHAFSREFHRLFGAPAARSSASAAPPAPPVVPRTIWISPYHASLATSIVLARATESEREALDRKMMEYVVTNVPDEERPAVFLTPEHMGVASAPAAKKRPRRRHAPAKSDADADSEEDEAEPLQFIDAHLWIELMMLEYKEEQAHRRAAIRLMFQTASSSVASGDERALVSLSAASAGGAIGVGTGATMDMEQFRVMVRTLNDETPAFIIATLFRNAYARGNGVVTFDAFMDAAEATQFFSTCMRLESPASCLARLVGGGRRPLAPSSRSAAATAVAPSPLVMAVATNSRAAFLVEKLFAILRPELVATVAALPLWMRSVTDALVAEISAILLGSSDSSGGSAAYSDGMKLLSSFHRLIEYLQLAKLVQREVTGAAVSSKHIAGIEKALQALVDSVRLRDKSSVETLIDTVKHKLCVKRVQLAFRRHLRREAGAPLAMRALMHRDYGRALRLAQAAGDAAAADSPLPALRSRNAVRSADWLLVVVSSVFRASLKSHRVPALLTELSSVSGAILGAGAAHALDSPSADLAALNGGVGPAPRSVLLELIYDLFIGRFGTRWEAEKLIHDLFATCRAVISRGGGRDGGGDGGGGGDEDGANAPGHPLAWLFGYVCCMDSLPPYPRAMSEDLGGEDLSGDSGTGGGASSSDDRLLGQNEAVAFVQAILRCNLHPFALVDPVLEPTRGHRPSESPADESSPSPSPSRSPSPSPRAPADESWKWPSDWMPVQTAEKILTAAFVKLDAGEAQRMRARLRAQVVPAPAGGGDVVDAGAFLVLALLEWRRYVLARMAAVRDVCRALGSGELEQFERVLPLETVATVLQKAGVAFGVDELGVVFRRLLATEPPPSASAAAEQQQQEQQQQQQRRQGGRGGASSSSPPGPSLAAIRDRLSERVAAASFPLVAREPLARLLELEDAAPVPFKIEPNARLSLQLLVLSWRAYERPSRELMDELRHVGKSNDIQAEAFSRSAASSSTYQRHILYLSSSTAGNLSSQDVAQLEAVHALFLDRLAMAERVVKNAERMEDHGGADDGTPHGDADAPRSRTSRLRRSSVTINKHDGSMRLLDDEETHENVVNEAWKVFRQLLVGLAKLRALAGLGSGALRDALDGTADGATASA